MFQGEFAIILAKTIVVSTHFITMEYYGYTTTLRRPKNNLNNEIPAEKKTITVTLYVLLLGHLEIKLQEEGTRLVQ